MGHPSRAGIWEWIWASGLATRFLTSCPPARIRIGGISASEPGWPWRNKRMPWSLLCATHQHPNNLPSLEHLPQELREGSDTRQSGWATQVLLHPSTHPPSLPGFGAAQGIWHSRGQKTLSLSWAAVPLPRINISPGTTFTTQGPSPIFTHL